MRSSLLFNFITVVAGTFSASAKAGKLDFANFVLTFEGGVALSNVIKLRFNVALNDEIRFHCHSFSTGEHLRDRDNRQGICYTAFETTEMLWFDLKSIPSDLSILPLLVSGEIQLELYYRPTSLGNLQVITAGIPAERLSPLVLADGNQLRLELPEGEKVEDEY